MTDQACGRIGLHTVSRCADKAADALCGLLTPHAVCLAPSGHVSVEPVDKALVSFESTELAAMTPEDLRDVEALKLREAFQGRFVKHNELEKAA